MDADIPPPPALWTTANPLTFMNAKPSRIVLTITADGKLMRGDRPLDELPRDELLKVIGELVDLLRTR